MQFNTERDQGSPTVGKDRGSRAIPSTQGCSSPAFTHIPAHTAPASPCGTRPAATLTSLSSSRTAQQAEQEPPSPEAHPALPGGNMAQKTPASMSRGPVWAELPSPGRQDAESFREHVFAGRQCLSQLWMCNKRVLEQSQAQLGPSEIRSFQVCR